MYSFYTPYKVCQECLHRLHWLGCMYARSHLNYRRLMLVVHMRESRGGGGAGDPNPPGKIHTYIYGVLAILVRFPWKITILPSQHSMLGLYRPASETPFKWRFATGSVMARF